MVGLLDRGISGGNSSSGFYVASRIAALDFKRFQRCVWLWLGASGYKHMRSGGRRTERGRGASGPDFIVRVGEDGMDVAVQVRHWNSPVSKRAVDEFRGLLLRENIPAGMIVAKSHCSRAARLAAAEFPGRPIRIIGIDRFVESMMQLEFDLSARFLKMLGKVRLGYETDPSEPKSRRTTRTLADVDFGDQRPNWWLFVLALVLLGIVIAGAVR